MNQYRVNKVSSHFIVLILTYFLISCSSTQGVLPPAQVQASATVSATDYHYLIGPNDTINLFVWRNPEVSGSFIVRPDGKITTPLVADIDVAGLKPTEVEKLIAAELSTFIREPQVSVSVTSFVGPYSEQVRVIGEASQPLAINFREHMTLLDLMIQVGGLTEFADGNGAVLIRVIDGKQAKFTVKLNDLIKNGDISANVDMKPGDVVIIPEAWF